MTEEEKKEEEEEKERELIITKLAEKIVGNLLKTDEYAGKTAVELLNDDNLYIDAVELIIFEAALSGIDVKKSGDGKHVLVY